MSDISSYDSNNNGYFDYGEIDRWQLDNGGYPGQFENEPSNHGQTGSGGCLVYGCYYAIKISIGFIIFLAILLLSFLLFPSI